MPGLASAWDAERKTTVDFQRCYMDQTVGARRNGVCAALETGFSTGKWCIRRFLTSLALKYIATTTAKAAKIAPTMEPTSEAVLRPVLFELFCAVALLVGCVVEVGAVWDFRGDVGKGLIDGFVADNGAELIVTSRPGKLALAACAVTVVSPAVAQLY